MVDSSFFWGYLITQIPGGFLASVFPANRIFGAAICTSAVLNMVVPGAMSLDNVTVLLLLRVLQGLVEVRNGISSNNFEIFMEMLKFTLKTFTGRGVSSLSRYLALLGTSTRAFTSSNNSLLRFLCWNCVRYAAVGILGTIHQLAGSILFLFNWRYYLVFGMALASL